MSQNFLYDNHFGKMEQSLPTNSDTEVVDDLFVLMPSPRQPGSDRIAEAITNDMRNLHGDKSAACPSVVVSRRHLRDCEITLR